MITVASGMTAAILMAVATGVTLAVIHVGVVLDPVSVMAARVVVGRV